MKVANLSQMLGALNYHLVLFSEGSQIDLTLTTVYHFFLSWRREVRIFFIGDRRAKRGAVGKPLDTAAPSMAAQLDVGIEAEGWGTA